jgi:hypothetical protein
MIRPRGTDPASILDSYKAVLAECAISIDSAPAAGIRSASARDAKDVPVFRRHGPRDSVHQTG